jgi:hypothetical protein
MNPVKQVPQSRLNLTVHYPQECYTVTEPTNVCGTSSINGFVQNQCETKSNIIPLAVGLGVGLFVIILVVGVVTGIIVYKKKFSPKKYSAVTLNADKEEMAGIVESETPL